MKTLIFNFIIGVILALIAVYGIMYIFNIKLPPVVNMAFGSVGVIAMNFLNWPKKL